MDKHHLDLRDVLALRYTDAPGTPLRIFTDWAEMRLDKSEANDNLLILASLGFDKHLVKSEVYQYLDSYLLASNIPQPSEGELRVFSIRHSLKEMAFSHSEPELWGGLSGIEVDYDLNACLFKRVIDYWSTVQRDFIHYEDDEYGYLYHKNPTNQHVPKALQADYVRKMAARFIRLLECDYFWDRCIKHENKMMD
ncbi:hypothetical protein [Pantoea rwandensis]|nr:hypothetical protein [Pantoea rwandensis]